MMNDWNAVGGQVYIELETVRAGGESDIERRNRILGTERASAAVSEHEGTGASEKM